MLVNAEWVRNLIENGTRTEVFRIGRVATDVPSGFTGFTLEVAGALANANGEVTRVQFAVPYMNRKFQSNPNITTAGTFRARTGDNRLINLSAPTVVGVTNTHCVLQFTLATAYPSNSPMHLVYADNNATITVTPTAFQAN
jgi:hypothetical protein